MRRYDEMIAKAEDRYWDYPEDVQLQIYLAKAYNAKGQFDDALNWIKISGVLDNLANDLRGPEGYDAFTAMTNAAYGSGEIETARELIQLFRDNHVTGDSSDWWVALGVGCGFAIAGDDEEVYRRFERAKEGKNLAWEPMLQDAQCFKRFANDPEYKAMVRHFDELRANLRERLLGTLSQHGVVL